MQIGLGLDTGGTYTDAVLLDLEQSRVLASAKALTTHQDLKQGISNTLDALPADLLKQADFFSLSTTLATNACVEGKGKAAKLILIGVDPQVVQSNREKYGLPDQKDILFYQSAGTFSGEILEEPDWQKMGLDSSEFPLDMSAGIVELYAGRNHGVLEKAAKQYFEEGGKREIVCSHELFRGLNVLERSAGAYLNAGLLPVIRPFLEAIETALCKRGLNARIGIIRSDGSLMSESFAKERPVETLLCGPAASAIGAAFLAQKQNCIVVDMGGTTTDIALIQNGRPKMADGIQIGAFRTCVPGISIDTFALGGDSALHSSDGQLILEERRAVPLCVAAQKYPQLEKELESLARSERKHTRPLQDFFLLDHVPQQSAELTADEIRLCQALEDGPLSIERAAHAIGLDLYNLKTERLEKEGILIRCGMTPTDIMHIRGDFTSYNRQASVLGARHMALQLGLSVEAFCQMVTEKIQQKLYLEIIRVLLRHDPAYQDVDYPELLLKHIAASQAKQGQAPALFEANIHTDYTLVGIGAPIHVFLPDVAARLKAQCVIPPYAAVANAVGAVISQIEVMCEILIQPVTEVEGIGGYRVFGPQDSAPVKTLEEAVDLAKAQAEASVRKEAAARGLFGPLTITFEQDDRFAEARDCPVYLESVVKASAKSQSAS